jgi:hypothetical protein
MVPFTAGIIANGGKFSAKQQQGRYQQQDLYSNSRNSNNHGMNAKNRTPATILYKEDFN